VTRIPAYHRWTEVEVAAVVQEVEEEVVVAEEEPVEEVEVVLCLIELTPPSRYSLLSPSGTEYHHYIYRRSSNSD
jgi:hypothetical protein